VSNRESVPDPARRYRVDTQPLPCSTRAEVALARITYPSRRGGGIGDPMRISEGTMTMSLRGRHAGVAISLLTAAVLFEGSAGSALAAPVVTNFSFTGALQSYQVPANICSVSVTADGGHGAFNFSGVSIPGGKAARVSAHVLVTPGEALSVLVAGGAPPSAGGFGGGGSGGGGGAGASVVSTTARALVVAGGGGGAGWNGFGGDGGLLGADGSSGTYFNQMVVSPGATGGTSTGDGGNGIGNLGGGGGGVRSGGKGTGFTVSGMNVIGGGDGGSGAAGVGGGGGGVLTPESYGAGGNGIAPGGNGGHGSSVLFGIDVAAAEAGTAGGTGRTGTGTGGAIAGGGGGGLGFGGGGAATGGDGGGGGGYGGGGGSGGFDGGGGGGSSFVIATALSSSSALSSRPVDGQVTISYDPADLNDNCSTAGEPGDGGPSPVGSTPELDSLFLFGSGLASLGGYAVLRLRARRLT
jgi:hypothetical protein